MSQMSDVWCQLLGIVIGSAYALSPSCATAQITPDRTLPNNTTVTINGSTFNITGGTQAGRNLFHSFQQFSVPTGGTASFNNGLDIQNIISRVTGGSVSDIDGLIKASGTANVFFLNPSGIVFGKNASLNVGGSFLASTASSINFADGTKFSVNPSQTTPLLTISVPIGLQFGGTVNPITVQGSALEVPTGRTLALVGGDVSFDGGSLQALNGRVELGAIASTGTVGLNLTDNNLSLSFPDLVPRANISLNGATINVTDRSQGSVAVTGHNIDILQKSMISAGIGSELTAVGSSPGDIDINATGTVTINQASRLSNQVNDGATGNAGNINIKAGEISITNQDSNIRIDPNIGNFIPLDAALITEPKGVGRAGDISLESNGSITLIGQNLNGEDKVISTFSQSGGLGGGNISLKAKGSISLDSAFLVSSSFGGDSGKILLQGDESISMVNSSSLVSTNFSQQGNSENITLRSNGPISLQTSMISSNIGSTDQNNAPVQGNGGNIEISGKSVYVTDGALVTSSSYNSGRAGNIQINAKDLVELSGMGPPQPLRLQTSIYSSLTTSAEQEAQGSAGTISITTNTLKLSDGANIKAESTSTFAGSNGGNISINANVIDLTGGGQIFTTTSGVGNAGNITLKVADRITTSGTNPNFADTLRQAQAGDFDGNGIGSIDSASGIFANTSETSTGNGGNLSITTGQLFVRDGAKLTVSSLGSGNAGNLKATARLIQLDQGTISADTQGGEGNIRLYSSNLILGHGSNITTKATGSNVIGGNINIDTDTVAAVQNSKISADSRDFRGGQVKINAQSIFLSPDSSITAKGVNQQLNGTVEIITPGIDPSRGLVILPMVTENTPQPISSTCAAFNETGRASDFTITGRGGLPPNPNEPLTSDVVWTDTHLPTITTQHQHKKHASLPKPQPIAIVPATGWVFNGKGEVTLISSASNATTVNTPTSCPAR